MANCSGGVDQQAEIWMAIAGHLEMITFDIALLGKHNIMSGLPWLQHHNPMIQWSSGKLTFASDYCEQHCHAVSASAFLCQKAIIPTTIPNSPKVDPEAELLVIEEVGISVLEILSHLTTLKDTIPEEYWDFLDIFDGQKAATTLPNL